MASDEEIPTEAMLQDQPWPIHLTNDAHGTTDSHPGSCHSKYDKTTDNIAVRTPQGPIRGPAVF